MDRSAVYNALTNQLKTITSAPYGLVVPVVELGLVHWDSATIQPAIYVDPEMETSKVVYGQPTVWTLSVSIWIYAKRDGNILGITKLMPIMDAVEAIIMPKRGSVPFANKLGGLVNNCALNGVTEISGGYLGTQSVARMGVEIVVPG